MTITEDDRQKLEAKILERVARAFDEGWKVDNGRWALGKAGCALRECAGEEKPEECCTCRYTVIGKCDHPHKNRCSPPKYALWSPARQKREVGDETRVLKTCEKCAGHKTEGMARVSDPCVCKPAPEPIEVGQVWGKDVIAGLPSVVEVAGYDPVQVAFRSLAAESPKTHYRSKSLFQATYRLLRFHRDPE